MFEIDLQQKFFRKKNGIQLCFIIAHVYYENFEKFSSKKKEVNLGTFANKGTFVK